MKIDVAAAKGTEEEMMKSWQEQLHLQSILVLDPIIKHNGQGVFSVFK